MSEHLFGVGNDSLHRLGTDEDGNAIYAPEDGPTLTDRGLDYWTDTDGCHHVRVVRP